MTPPNRRLAQQIDFIVAVDGLKQVCRRTRLIDDGRPENDAEHSWHLALMAVVLREYAAEDVDLARVLAMHLIHDLVEMDVGDTFAYDDAGQADREERERVAAERIFGLLPAEQGATLLALWEEFEARETPEARYAAAAWTGCIRCCSTTTGTTRPGSVTTSAALRWWRSTGTCRKARRNSGPTLAS